MTRHRIAVFNTGDTRRDPRVLRICGLLREQGHTVRVFDMRIDGQSPAELVQGLDVQRVAPPLDYSFSAMVSLAQISKAAADLLWRCEPLVVHHGRPTLVDRIRQFARLPVRRADNDEVLLQEVKGIRFIVLLNVGFYQQARDFAPTLVYCNDLDTLLAGFLLKRERGIPLIYDAHEIYPEQFAEHARSALWHRFYTALEQELIGHADVRLTVCDSLGDYFAMRYGASGFVTVRNVPSIAHLPPSSILERRNRPRRILYHGAYFPYRGLDEVIRAAPLVKDATFVFRGIGAHEPVLRRLAVDCGVADRVRFEIPVGVDDLVRTASECDIGLNPFVDVCKNTAYALPNKFFEYMMAGLALASSDLIEMRQLTRQLAVGVLFSGLSPGEVADGLNGLLHSPDQLDLCRARSYEAARDRFNWECERDVMLQALGSLL